MFAHDCKTHGWHSEGSRMHALCLFEDEVSICTEDRGDRLTEVKGSAARRYPARGMHSYTGTSCEAGQHEDESARTEDGNKGGNARRRRST